MGAEHAHLGDVAGHQRGRGHVEGPVLHPHVGRGDEPALHPPDLVAVAVLDHDVVAMRDRARMLQEEVVAKTAEQTNERLQWLTVMTALFLPPTLVTGFWGMNLKGMPLAENESGGLAVIILCIASSALAFWLIRRKIKPGDG